MVEDDQGAPMFRHVRAGDVAYIPEGVFHATHNSSWEPMRLLAVYMPGGPEAILRELPDCVDLPGRRAPRSVTIATGSSERAIHVP